MCSRADSWTCSRHLAEVFLQPLVDDNIKVNAAKITGQSRSRPAGTWVQGGGLEVTCFYEVFVKQALPELKNSFKKKLSALNQNVDGTA